MPDAHRILVVEDDPAQLKLLRTVLRHDGWSVLEAKSGQAAIQQLERGQNVEVILSDLVMPGMDGRELLAVVRERWPEIPFVVLTAHASVDSAVELLHAGAHHYVMKPTRLPELRIILQRAIEDTEARRELARLRRRVNLPADIVGVSRAMQAIFETIVRVAPSHAPVLISGGTGTGKEVVARAIHAVSGRRNFVALNCAALPPSLVESELFGYRRGAFTDARTDHEGLVEVATAGTLFLDEVSEVPLATQPKLLRFLQDGEFRRLGETEERNSGARLIAATNRDPEEELAAGRLRDDLYYRLNVVHIVLPPLRERPVDIPVLAEHLLRRLAERYQLEPVGLQPEVLAALTRYHWPGNIRELENVIARALALKTGPEITLRDLPPAVAGGPGAGVPAGAPGAATAGAIREPAEPPEPAGLSLAEVERRHILRVLEQVRGNKVKAAEILGIDRSTLHRKLKQIRSAPLPG